MKVKRGNAVIISSVVMMLISGFLSELSLCRLCEVVAQWRCIPDVRRSLRYLPGIEVEENVLQDNWRAGNLRPLTRSRNTAVVRTKMANDLVAINVSDVKNLRTLEDMEIGEATRNSLSNIKGHTHLPVFWYQ